VRAGGTGGGPLVVAAVVRTTTTVTMLVVQVGVVQPGVPSLVKTAEFLMIWPLVSVDFTVAWKAIVRAFAVPGSTVIPVHVTAPALSETKHPAAPLQVADVAT